MPFNSASALSLSSRREAGKEAGTGGGERLSITSLEGEGEEIGLNFDHYHFTFGLLLKLFDTAVSADRVGR